MTLALAVVISANCLAMGDLTPEQKACCAAMQHDCGEMALQSSCCVGQPQDDRSVATTKPTIGVAHVVALLAILTTPPAQSSPERKPWRVENSSPTPPGVPTYLFVSSFRI